MKDPGHLHALQAAGNDLEGLKCYLIMKNCNITYDNIVHKERKTFESVFFYYMAFCVCAKVRNFGADLLIIISPKKQLTFAEEINALQPFKFTKPW